MMEQQEEVMVQVESENSRSVIEVKGKVIVLSKTKSRIESLFTSSAIEEVRIFAGETLDVDANLSRDVWHGRNLVVLAYEINVCTTVTWDVSGKDSDHTYRSDAGTGEDGHGKDGSDGYPGESGGNVLVQAYTIRNPERLTIISNGGTGGGGQDGGNGKDGVDGKGISEEEFKQNFPNCLKFWRSARIDLVTKLVQNIYRMAESVKIEWMKKKSLGRDRGPFVTSNLLEHLKDNNYIGIYLHVVTKEGNEILFSLWDETTQCHSFLVYKGLPAEPGKSGGAYGMGGQGGLPGEISLMGINDGSTLDICSQRNKGNDGSNGRDGLSGGLVKTGWDMGFLGQYGFLLKTVKFYGADQNSKLELSFSSEKASGNIYHPYMAQHSDCDKYVRIDEARIGDQSINSDRNNTIARNERQNHARAVGKKSVAKVRILSAFTEYFHAIEKERQEQERQQIEQGEENLRMNNLLGYLENDSLQQDVKKQNTDRKRLTNQTIKRFVNFSQDTTDQNRFEFIRLDELNANARKEVTLTILQNNFNPEAWMKLQSEIVSFNQLKSLVEHFESSKQKLDNSNGTECCDKIDLIAETLKIKYKFSILRKIAQVLPIYVENVGKVIPTAENATRYLEEVEEQDDSIHHPVLGSLKQYIFENSPTQRGKIATLIATTSKNKNNALKRAIEAYISGINGSKTDTTLAKQLYDDSHEFVNDQQSNIDSITKMFITKLHITNQEEVYQFWNKSVEDDALRDNLEKSLRQDKVLCSLCDKLTSEEIDVFDWDRCCVDEQIQDILKFNLEHTGITSKSYRMLLAYVFDVNLRVYIRDKDSKIVLKEEHNPKSTTAVHILLKAKELIQLKINNAYCQLEEKRLYKDKIYSKILSEVNAMHNIPDIESYFEKESFKQNSSSYFKNPKIFEVELAIRTIRTFFSAEEKDLVTKRLKSISPQYTGQEGVFESLLERFAFEGRHVSFNELCFLINTILAHTIEARQERYTFSWIISAYNQCNWTDELVLLQLENYFKGQLKNKAEWRNYMSNIHNKGVLLVFAAQFDRYPCSAECVEEILHLLSHVPIESVCIDQLELTEWPYVLKEYYWKQRLQSLTTWETLDNLTTATYFILSIENNHGKDKLDKMFTTFVKKRNKLTSDWLSEILNFFHNQKWILKDKDLDILKDKSLTEWQKHMDDTNKISSEELNVSQIAQIIQGNDNTSDQIKDHLSPNQDKVEKIKQNHVIAEFTIDNIKEWGEKFLIKKNYSSCEMYEEMLAIVNRAIELQRGFRLRDTQLLSVLALLANDKKTLAQVSTGEGKSLIVVATAVIKGLLGEKVDIITSSPVLAQRDASDNQDIYELFGLSASHNCSENMEERKDAYSCNQIMYGDLANFQRDYLLDSFYGKHVLGDRSFETVIVDEVDSMLLDKGNNILYLSHDIAGMDKLESVYVFIWQMVNIQTDLTKGEIVTVIKRSVLSDMFPSIQKENIASLDKAMGKSNVLELWDRLVKNGLMTDSGRLLTEEIDSNMMDKLLSPDFMQYKDRLSFLLSSRIERNTYIKVPNFLKPFVERHLDSWISSAITALNMDPKQYYVVDVDRSGTSADRHANVIILDRDTGTDQVSSQWDEALHQFLQLKHGCKLSTQNLKAVFISNVTYLKIYKLLYGLSGTLGSQRERHLLEEIHQVDFVTIPTAMPKQFEEYEPIICSSKETWIHHILCEMRNLTKTEKRSVLIICETIRDVESLTEMLDLGNNTNVHTYARDYEKFTVVEGDRMLEQGQIIIATNLAGRGTDIRITNELRDAGGLHVILTYLPVNIRIEEQAYGRAARKGEKGSGRMIILVVNEKIQTNISIFSLKMKRNVEELFRLSALKSYYKTTIKTEEDCFKTFSDLYGTKKKCLADAQTPDPVKEMLLQSCLDKWSFWLDENNLLMRKCRDSISKQQVKLLLDQFIALFEDLKQIEPISWSAWVEGNPMQMVKLAKYIAQHESKHNHAAFELFEKVIKNEPKFCEAAYYYRACTRTSNNMHIDDFKNDLRMAARLFEEQIKCALHASAVVGIFKKSTQNIGGYEEQKKNIVDVYSLLIQSINDMLGQAITPDSFVNYEIKKATAGKIFENLLQTGIIKRAEVVRNVTYAHLHKLHLEYGISGERLKQFFASNAGTIDEEELLGLMRNSFSFPSRSQFWETLVQQNVLYSVEEYVTVNENSLKKEKSGIMNIIMDKIDEGALVKEAIYLGQNQILLIHEDYSKAYFEQKKLISAISYKNFTSLKEEGLLSFNKKATIDMSKIAGCVFSAFDSITAEDITNKTKITTSEANIIIDELLRQKILEKRGVSFALTVNDEQNILLPTYPVYESAIRSVLASCFAYRFALRNIALQLEDEDCSIIRTQLKPDPHRLLFNDLLGCNIIQPPRLNATIDINTVVANVCENQQVSIDSAVAYHIKNVLERLKPTEGTSVKPGENLKSIEQIFEKQNFAIIDAIQILMTNGLEHLLQPAEKNVTVALISSIPTVACISLAQIAIGAIMEVCFGFVSDLTVATMRDAFEDIEFALNGGMSGHFSWKDFGKEKRIIAMALKQFKEQVIPDEAHQALRLFGPGFKYKKQANIEKIEKRLIKPRQSFFKTKAKVPRPAARVSFAVANTFLDEIAFHHLQTNLNSLKSNVLSRVRKEVDAHKVSQCLKKAHDTLGEGDSKALLEDLTNKYMTVQMISQIFLPIVRQLLRVDVNGMRNDSRETNNSSSEIEVTNRLDMIMNSEVYADQVAKMRTVTHKLMDSVYIEIERKISNVKLSSNSQENLTNATDLGHFQRKVIRQWETKLSEHVEQLLDQYIVQPVITMALKSVISYTGKALNDIRHKMEDWKKGRDTYKLQNKPEQKTDRPNMFIETERHLTEEYHSQLLKIMHKMRCPALLATIIRGNVPMDIKCVEFLAPMVHKMVQTQIPAITGLTITVHDEKGLKQSFSSGTGGSEIHLTLLDNHFTVSPVEGSPIATSVNYSLEGAIVTAFADFQTAGQEVFRSILSNYVTSTTFVKVGY